jgi:hypothetical protein
MAHSLYSSEGIYSQGAWLSPLMSHGAAAQWVIGLLHLKREDLADAALIALVVYEQAGSAACQQLQVAP